MEENNNWRSTLLSSNDPRNLLSIVVELARTKFRLRQRQENCLGTASRDFVNEGRRAGGVECPPKLLHPLQCLYCTRICVHPSGFAQAIRFKPAYICGILCVEHGTVATDRYWRGGQQQRRACCDSTRCISPPHEPMTTVSKSARTDVCTHDALLA